MTNLERLEKEIREKLPRLKPEIYLFINYYAPIVLSDVLEWLEGKMGKVEDFAVNSQGALMQHWYGGDYEHIKTETGVLAWNLEKPHLRDQSQELIDYLASLIEDHKPKYEMLFKSKQEDFIKIDGWVPIEESMIPEGKTDYYLKKGLIRIRQ